MLWSQKTRRVIVVGAGAAGLSAAFHLAKAGINVQVLEAASHWGGRMKRLEGFAGVPLDLGAEWIHADPTVLGEIVGQNDTQLDIETIRYKPRSYQLWDICPLKSFNLLRHFYEEVKFRNSTWYGYFEQHVVPAISNRIQLNTPVKQITTEGVRLPSGKNIPADHVIVTVPLSVLQRRLITLAPALTPPEYNAIDTISFGNGFKSFLKFNERFYPDLILQGSRWQVIADDSWDQKIYYDAAFGKPTTENILGLFTVAQGELPRTKMSDQLLIENILDELTDMFGTVVRNSFQQAAVQNWTREPTILGSYSMDIHGDLNPREILTPVDGRLFFAGEVLGDSRSTVHGAAFSGIATARAIIDA